MVAQTLRQHVFLHYTQAELDAAYDQNVWARDREAAWRRRAEQSDEARRRIGNPRQFVYGMTEVERLDLYPAAASSAPTLILLHGGAWRRGTASDHAFAAPLFTSSGVHYVVPDFANVQDVGGDLKILAAQVRRAVVWTYRNVATFGGDPERIYLAGHSSGAHLASAALLTDWAQFDAPSNIVKAALCVSGLYDLRGARLSARNTYVDFTDETEHTLSAARHVDKIRCPVTVAYGTAESPEFQRMGVEFATGLKTVGRLAELIRAEGYDHFQILESLSEKDGIIGRAAIEMIGRDCGSARCS